MANGILINQTTDFTDDNILRALNVVDEEDNSLMDIIKISKKTENDNFIYQTIEGNFTPSKR